jgi:flagellar basal body L-ring protein FlgH
LTLFLCSCAAVNPFKNDRSNDYNAITYGDEGSSSSNRGGRWGNGNVEVPRASAEDYDFPARGPAASRREMPQNDGADEALDPSEESVRAKIEAKRSRGDSGKSRGDRVTRADFYDNAPSDGSLWANENDGNYFFTKGKVHSVGDIISVKLEDPLIKQFAEEIKKSLTPPEQEVEMALYLRNTDGTKNDQDLKAYRNVASDDLNSEAGEVKARMEKAVRWSQVDLSKVIGLNPQEELRAEIVDRYQNGNFKIRAVKRVLYRGSSKMISLVAVAPVSDFDEKDMINSGKLYEYKIRVAR